MCFKVNTTKRRDEDVRIMMERLHLTLEILLAHISTQDCFGGVIYGG